MVYIRRTPKKIKAVTQDSSAISWIYQPQGFNPSKYPGPIAQHPDAARWLLSTIYLRRLTRQYDKSSFINLHSALLSLVMGKTEYVKPVSDACRRHGLIECDGQYTPGQKSLGYRLGPVLADVVFERYTSEDKRFLKRVAKFRQHEFSSEITIPTREHLADWCRKVEFAPGLPDALADLPNKPYPNCDYANKRAYAQHQVEEIQAGHYEFTQSCPYGRFHSNFTSLVSEVRRCLILDGEPLHELDIVNSQPYFLATILYEIGMFGHCLQDCSSGLFAGSEDHSLFVSSFSDSSISSVFSSSQEEQEGGAGSTKPYVFPLGLESGGLGKIETEQDKQDLNRLLQDTSEGTFYEKLQSHSPELTREEVKRSIFQTIFGEAKLMHLTSLGQVFQKTYPTAAHILLESKRTKGYKWIGHELQRRESQVVINVVCERLRCDYGDVPLVTVHDSILTTQRNLGLVSDLLTQACQRYPYPPTFKTKEPR